MCTYIVHNIIIVIILSVSNAENGKISRSFGRKTTYSEEKKLNTYINRYSILSQLINI